MNKEKKIADEILKHKELYYKGNPTISDEEFDNLERSLKDLNPNHPVLNLVGHIVESKEKIKHSKKMLSLDKCYDFNKFLEWKGSEDVLGTYKIDGSSCSLIYKNGTLVTAKTRGDGSFGENILPKVLYIESIPKTIEEKKEIEIRGEIYCTDKKFDSLKKQMDSLNLALPSSQRNIVAGILGRKDNIFLSKSLEFQAFEVFGDENFETEESKFIFLEKQSFKTPEFKIYSEDIEIKNFLDKAEDFIQNGHYLIDGLVFTFNNCKLHDRLGETAHHPRYKMAFKFQSETKEAKIESIFWGISRNGILTPVALIEPVDLSGALVSKVTLHNFGLVKEENLKAGDTIELTRSGEVIPKFLKVINSTEGNIKIPNTCPACKSELLIQEIRLVCENDECSGQLKESMQYFLSSMGIEDVSSKRIEAMLEANIISDIPSFYKLTKEKLLSLDKVKDKLADKILNNIEQSKKVSLIKFINSLGISSLGTQKIEKIIHSGFNTIELFLSLSVENLVSIDGFAEKSAVDIIASIKKKRKIIESLLSVGIEFSKVEKIESNSNINGLKFCITGTLKRKRSDIQKMIKNLGGEIASSVTAKTNYLVCNDDSTSSKFKKAQQLGTTIITEEDLYKLMD